MALFNIQFYSISLARSTQMLVLLPNDVVSNESDENYQRGMKKGDNPGRDSKSERIKGKRLQNKRDSGKDGMFCRPCS